MVHLFLKITPKEPVIFIYNDCSHVYKSEINIHTFTSLQYSLPHYVHILLVSVVILDYKCRAIRS